jgi:hypothetical protein
MNITRNGKIARLPKAVRDELNRRLSDGEPGKELVAWLNGLPEVQSVVAAEFGGRAVREQNLSEWKSGGYREWLQQQEALELVRCLSAEAQEVKEAAGEPLTEKLGLWLVARYAVASRKLAGKDNDGEIDWPRLREFCSDVVALRRGDHSAARLKIEQERLERERQKTEEEVVEHFKRWAQNPAIKDCLCDKYLSPKERAARTREIYGLPPEPAAEAAPTAPESDPVKPSQTESGPIRPNQTE